MRAAGVPEVTDADFDAEVPAAGLPLLVEITADRCGPCRQPAPVPSAVAAEEAGRIKVVQIDVDSNPVTQSRYGVLSMPTLLVFRRGEPVRQMVGARAERKLLQEIDEALTA